MTVEARQAAIEALYEADQRELKEAAEGLPARAARMVTGVLEHQTDLDRLIDAASDHWRINRMILLPRSSFPKPSAWPRSSALRKAAPSSTASSPHW